MDGRAADEIFLFEGFRLDPKNGGLFRVDESGVLAPVAIGSRALDLLILLIRRHGELVSKDEMMTAVWPGMIVEDSNLPTQISALRRILDQGRLQGSCIQTVSGRGYRFVAWVTHPDARDPIGASAIGGDAGDRAEDARPAAPIARAPTRAGGSSQPWRRVLNVLAAPSVIRSLSARTGDHRRSGSTNAPRLSIIVLPFINLSGYPDQQLFADRITADLTTDLSRFTGMRMISRSTAFTYRHRLVNAKQIGRELGVRYVLEGSVQRYANHLRVNIQLIDAESDMHLWAERFDRDPGDLFGVRNEITKRTAVSLYHVMLWAEASRPTDHPDALDYILWARAAKFEPLKRDDYEKVVSLFGSAVALDPRSAEAQAWLADTLASRALEEMAEAAGADIARAAELAARAVAASPCSAAAHMAKGRVLCAQGRYQEAIFEYEVANAINPSWPHVYGAHSDAKLWCGSIEDAIPLAERAIGIRPHDAFSASWYLSIGRVHLLQSRTHEALVWLEKARIANSQYPAVHAMLASAYALNGESERAAAELAEARGLSCDGRYSNIARLKAAAHFGVPKVRGLFEATYLTGLRKARMPEE
jgi:TolB-like protein/DNA-binding winged helix-turn-helix (wHTH) protein/Flp pilus assembly protein TadD